MPLVVRYIGTFPAGVQARLQTVVDAINQSGQYDDRVYNATVQFDTAGYRFNPLFPPEMERLSGWTNGNRYIWLNPIHDGDRPIEDRFLHEIVHVLRPNTAVGRSAGEHPFAFYEEMAKLYRAIRRPFEINDSVYETDSQIYRRLGGSPLAPQCFLSGTPIDMADGSQKPIEQITTGDMVMAFDGAAEGGRGVLAPRRVTRPMRNVADTIIDLRGLKMTPGHVCLTGEGDFEQIIAILREDRTLVERGGRVIRARTGAAQGSQDDTPVRIRYRDPQTGGTKTITARAGIPCCRRKDGGWASLAALVGAAGGRLLEDGAMERHGVQYASLNWPENELGHTQTPFELEAQRNFILRDEKDEAYTPAWIADIGDAREGMLEIVNGPGTGRMNEGLGILGINRSFQYWSF